MTEPDQKIFDFLPKPAKRLPFRLLKVENVYLPHSYCLTPKHLKYADSMVLDEASAIEAEAKGTKCDTCRRLYKAGRQAEILPLSKHEKQKALFIEVEDNQDLNQIKGLHKYLWKIRPLAETLGIQGFAFPRRKPDLQLGSKGKKGTEL